MNALIIRVSNLGQLTLEHLELLGKYRQIYTNLGLNPFDNVNTAIVKNIKTFTGSVKELLSRLKDDADGYDSLAIIANIEWKEFYNLKSGNVGIQTIDCGLDNDHKYSFKNLIELMDILRGEEGCPWDREQDHDSLKPYLLEESYELLEAIQNKDEHNLIEELGDVLLQTIFHSQIAKEQKRFSISDVIDTLVRKLVYRHPHVFKDLRAKDEDQATKTWEQMKAQEVKSKQQPSVLKKVPSTYPALIRSLKVQSMAAKVGFDWADIYGALDKFQEETKELMEAIEGNGDIQEEFGDLLFSIVNVARFIDVNPELALNNTVTKFINRFSFMEQEARKMGKNLQELPLDEQEDLWNRAKIHKI